MDKIISIPKQVRDEGRKKGFTLIEVLMAVSIFSAIGLIAVNIFVNITRLQSRVSLENAIYEDSRFLMERISREVRNNAIDYEEYFNKSANIGAASACKQYGDMYGFYAAQFYHPGVGDASSLTIKPGAYGAFCNDKTPYQGQNCTLYKPSLDNNLGKYLDPNTSVGTTSNAFCPQINFGLTCDPTKPNNLQDSLYLISADGKKKEVFAKKQINANPDYAFAEIKLKGEDSNNDGISEKWRQCGTKKFCCDSGFSCETVPALSSLESSLVTGGTIGIYDGFVPISPLRTNIKSIKFLINPNQDPYKDFAEPAKVIQPTVTIFLTVAPSASELNKYPIGYAPEISLQTTVTTRVQTEVKSYLGYGTKDIGMNNGVPYADTKKCP